MLRDDTIIDKPTGVDGRFEFDAAGYSRFIFADEEKKKAVEQWLRTEIARREQEDEVRFDAQAENRETYSAVAITIPDGGGKSVLPSPIARIPADQVIASTHNVIMRPRRIMSCDPYYDEQYPVLVPAAPPDPTQPAPSGAAQRIMVRSEEIARNNEQAMNFLLRERLDFERKNHRVVHNCAVEGYSWIKTIKRTQKREFIRPKPDALAATDTEERSADVEQVTIEFVHDSNMLRSNMHDEIDDLEWLAERDPESPDQLLAKYANDDYYLISDDEEAKDLAKSVSATLDERRRRTDASTRKVTDDEIAHTTCDTRDVWAKKWFTVRNDEAGKNETRRFFMLFRFHNGAGKLLSAQRNPYHHQEFIHTPFQQFIDGSCTVGIVKYNQQMGTYLAQAELKNATLANNHRYWYDPQSTTASRAFADGVPQSPGIAIPAKHGEEWGSERGGSEHFSLLPVMQWNDAKAQQTSKVSDYEAGAAAPSHTSPNTVSMLLDKSGQTNVLFLRMLSRGWGRVIKLLLKTGRQFQPLGSTIPIRDPKTRAVTMVPYLFPLDEAIDNFRWSLTAADEEAASERDPQQMAQLLDTQQRHIASVMQSFGAIVAPETTEAQMEFYRKALGAEQSIMNRIISITRSDIDTFDLSAEVDAVISEKRAMIAQARVAQEAQAANAGSQSTNGGGVDPAAAATAGDVGGSAGVGAESGVDVGAPPVADVGLPPTIAEGSPQG